MDKMQSSIMKMGEQIKNITQNKEGNLSGHLNNNFNT